MIVEFSFGFKQLATKFAVPVRHGISKMESVMNVGMMQRAKRRNGSTVKKT
jgi:hypothetical protein